MLLFVYLANEMGGGAGAGAGLMTFELVYIHSRYSLPKIVCLLLVWQPL